MATGKAREMSQYDNFIEICRGYQENEPDIQPKISHPHLIQHNVAIILRVRQNTYGYNSDMKSMVYSPPSYNNKLKAPATAFNANKPVHKEIHAQTTPCLVKILPKLYEDKVINPTMLELKNRSIGFMPSKHIDDHFRANLDVNDVSVEYLVIRRSKTEVQIEDNKDNVFAGYSSFPGGLCEYGETAMDAVIRNTYEQTGVDLTDNQEYCLIAQNSNVFKMRYLPNKRVICAKAFVFLQLVPEAVPLPKPHPGYVSMYLWSHVDFLYKCDMSKHLEYREVTTELLKRRFNHVKLAHLKIANAEKYALHEVVKDNKKCDPMFSL
jgi:8-oxo-dGTP pyrophosphatase MutT (NUDIX family)